MTQPTTNPGTAEAIAKQLEELDTTSASIRALRDSKYSLPCDDPDVLVALQKLVADAVALADAITRWDLTRQRAMLTWLGAELDAKIAQRAAKGK